MQSKSKTTPKLLHKVEVSPRYQNHQLVREDTFADFNMITRLYFNLQKKVLNKPQDKMMEVCQRKSNYRVTN